jgi:hypothetical protein
VRQRGYAIPAADLGVREGVVDGGEEVVDGCLELLDERRGNAMRTRGHMDAQGLEVHSVRIALAHAGVDGEERNAGAVDRNLDLLTFDRAAEQLTGGDRVQHHAEAVFPVRGEIVDDGNAASRAEGRPRDVPGLRGGAVDLVGRLGGRGVFVADRERADLAGRAEITFH